MLDRTTTAASERSERVARGGGGSPRQRRLVLAGAGVLTLVALYLSRYYPWAAEFPETGAGPSLAAWVNSAADWVIAPSAA